MARTEFQMAVQDALEDEDGQPIEPDEVIYDQEFGFGEFTLHTRMPSETEILVFFSNLSEGGLAAINAVWHLIARIAQPTDYRPLRMLVENDVISHSLLYGGDDDNAKGVIDLLVERRTANPSRGRADSTPSSNRTGRASTGRSPGAGSTRSR